MEAHGGTAGFTDEEATAPMGLSKRAFEKTSEALEIVLPGLREKLARGDTSTVEDDVDAFLEMDGINLDRASPDYRRLSY